MSIQIHEPNVPAITHVGAASIEATAHALVHAHQIGTALCKTAFVPKHFQGKPDDAAAAILYGSTIDMDPVTALQNIYVISGKPALYARTMVAIVLSKGHELWTEEELDGHVTVAGRRKGTDAIERVTWTAAMAQRAGYTSNANYKTNQRAMLYARASGDVARRIAPDALLGMAHNVEELIVSEQAPQAAPKAAGDRLRAALRPTVTAEQVVPEPSPAPDVDASAEPTPAPSSGASASASAGEPITPAQVTKIATVMGKLGIVDRDSALMYVNDVLPEGREVASRNELTKAEAHVVIEALEAEAAQS